MLPRGRGGFAALAIQSILQNGMQGLVGIAVDVKCTLAGRMKVLASRKTPMQVRYPCSGCRRLRMTISTKVSTLGPTRAACVRMRPVGTEAVVCWHDHGWWNVAGIDDAPQHADLYDKLRPWKGPKLLAHKLMEVVSYIGNRDRRGTSSIPHRRRVHARLQCGSSNKALRLAPSRSWSRKGDETEECLIASCQNVRPAEQHLAVMR